MSGHDSHEEGFKDILNSIELFVVEVIGLIFGGLVLADINGIQTIGFITELDDTTKITYLSILLVVISAWSLVKSFKNNKDSHH